MAFALHTLVPLADLTPFSAPELKYLAERTLPAYHDWKPEDHFFPPHLGLKGGRGETPAYLGWLPFELGMLLLTNEEAVEVEPRKPDGCLSSLAWTQKHFVMQTPSYQLTVVGAGVGFEPDLGMLDAGMVTSGGEYVLQIPGGEFLTPLSNLGRTLIQAKVNGTTLRSSEVTFTNREEFDVRMEAVVSGKRIARGEDYGPPAYDPRAQELDLEVSFGKYGVRLIRRFQLKKDRVMITDSLQAMQDVEVESASSRLPMITVGPRGEEVSIKGQAGGKELEIVPPCTIVHPHPFHDQDIIESLNRLELLSLRYPGFGMEARQLSLQPIRVRISKGEWQENRRMRVDGKNLDYLWIWEPVKLSKGESRSFQYELIPRSGEASR